MTKQEMRNRISNAKQELKKELAKKNPDIKRCTFLKATVGRYNNLLERR